MPPPGVPGRNSRPATYIALDDFEIGVLGKILIAKKHEIKNTDRIHAIQEQRNKHAAFVASASRDKNGFHGVDREIGMQKLHDFPKMPSRKMTLHEIFCFKLHEMQSEVLNAAGSHSLITAPWWHAGG